MSDQHVPEPPGTDIQITRDDPKRGIWITAGDARVFMSDIEVLLIAGFADPKATAADPTFAARLDDAAAAAAAAAFADDE